MYTIRLNDDHTFTATEKERIMHRSKNVTDLRILVSPTYDGIDMTQCTVLFEYLLPVSKKYDSKILTADSERYRDYMQFIIPFDTDLTAESGDLQIQLTLLYVTLDESGNNKQYARKTDPFYIPILPIAAWSDWAPDSALTALDQRIIKTDAQIKALEEMNTIVANSKADNIKYDETDNSLQLLSGESEIGDRVIIKNGYDENGIPFVTFNEAADLPEDKPEDEIPADSVDFVEF